MESPQNSLDRRTFMKVGAVAAGALAMRPALGAERKIKLGLDNFAVRAMKWKADALIDYAAQLKTDSLFPNARRFPLAPCTRAPLILSTPLP